VPHVIQKMGRGILAARADPQSPESKTRRRSKGSRH